MMDKVGHFIGEGYRDVAKKFMSVLKDSKFYEEGVLTPEEYIKAGDFLTQKCPTWKWCSSNTKVDYLPDDKQYLQTTVPCPMRVADYEKMNKTSERLVDDDWIEADVNFYNRKKDDEIRDIDDESNNKQIVVNNIHLNDNYMDIDIVKDDNKPQDGEVNEDFIVIEQNDDENVIKTRTYDVSVTYDFFYRVPRMWLTGYNENGIPLDDKEINEDIMMEYIDRTVTIEKHPHTGVKSVSIHPCKHSLLLLKMIENFERAGKKLDVHMSILLFLKFLHSVVPTIQYDFTMDINF